MKNLITAAISILLLTTLLCGAAAAEEWTPVSVTDANGDVVTITAYPEKIISLAPASTEIIYAVGAGDRLVGDTTYCNYPEEAKSVEKIGEFSTINRERIIALSEGNSVIFANPNNGRDAIDYLKKQGCTVIVINPDSIDKIYESISVIGEAVGCKGNADTLNAEIKAGIDAVAEKVSTVSSAPTVMHALSTDPFYVSGKNTFQDDLIKLAGGKNAFEDVDGWKTVTLEKLLITDPEIILTDPGADMGTPGFDSLRETFLTEPRLSTLSAAKSGKVFVMDADIFDRGGPRTVDALETLAQILHPEIFGEVKETSAASTPGFGVCAVLAGIFGTVFLMRKRE
ncbi:MAG TPA: ABC transporter substrate-binding protein [Methanocorpusculum sp.]|nr:ABC transporter substrate-binding protein [Methanocorpusculum sp.]